MAIKMSMTCTRCHREDIHEIETLALATALEALQVRKAATLKKLEDFVASLPQDELPDFYAVLGEKVLFHTYLCDPPPGGKDGKDKRSCAKRVGDLLSEVTERDERKPRTKKDKAPAAAAAPAAPK